MDQKINVYLDSLVSEVLNLPSFANLPENQKVVMSEKVNSYLNKVIIETILAHLNPEKLNVIKTIDPKSLEIESKIEEYASQIPYLAEELEEKLNQAVANLKQNPQIIS